jgi:hypothetical protein
MRFRKFGPVFLPQSFAAWLVSAVTVAMAVLECRFADAHSHSVSDMLINAVPDAATLLGLLWLLAAARSKPSGR